MLVKTGKASKITGLHPNTLRKYAEQGKIPHTKDSRGNRLYDVSAYQNFKVSAMPEYQRQNKNQTSKGNANICRMNFRTQKWSKILEADSASKEKVFKPYWNGQCEENVSQLLSHIGIDWLVSASDLLNGLLPVPKAKSWCLIKSIQAPPKSLQQTSWLLSQFSHHGYTDLETTAIKSKMILLHPTTIQKDKLRQWMGAYRWAYNKTIDYCLTKEGYSYMAMRKIWKEKMLSEALWIKSIPAHTIYGAMMDASISFKNHIIKLHKKQSSSTPRMNKRKQKSFFILGNSINKKGIYSRLLGELRSSEELPFKPKDSRIIKLAGKWYVKIPENVKTRCSENQARVVSVDYGIRTFLTCFSPDSVHKIGDGSFNRIVRLLLSLDKLKSKMSKERCRVKRKMKLACERLSKRIKDLIDDLHYQSISFLLENFDTIIVPDNNFKSAVCKARRKIRAKSVRALLGYAFSTFTNRLEHKCLIYGKRLIKVCESYTSKTANWTGEIIHNLGGRKTITSNGIKIDRDINGGLGIMLKSLLVQPSEKISLAFVNKN